MSMKDIILKTLDASIAVKTEFFKNNGHLIIQCAECIVQCLTSGHKLLIFGNGGSAADAQHMAAEFVNRFEIDRTPLSAIALTTDSSILTSIGNDFSFDDVFKKQIDALGKKDDIALGISTSGNSKNVVTALGRAREKGLATIGLTGKNGGQMVAECDHLMCVATGSTARIQETHITVIHVLCDLVDRLLFPERF